MDIFGLLAALFLPWLLGVVGLRARWLKPGDIAWPTLLGYGYLAGALATTLVMRLLDLLGMRLGFLNIALALVLLIALGIWAGRGMPWHGLRIGSDWRALAGWHKAAFAGLLALIVVRLAGLGLEIIWQPLFPWDAWSQWATKARVWYETGHLIPFAPPDVWLQGGAVYYDRAPHYPPAIPLLQAWISFGLGRWDDTLMSLPWLMGAVALTLAFYGQARQWGIAPLFAMMFTYFLISLPLLDAHVALAGNADLFLGAAYGLAAFAFFHWTRSRATWQGAMAILLGAGCILLKQPGIGWALTLLPAFWVALAPRAGLIGTLTLGVLGLAGLLLFGQGGFHLLGYTLKFAYTPVWLPLWDNLAVLDNWHLLFYLAAAALLAFLPRLFAPAYRAMTVAVGSALAFILAIFFFTHVSAWVEDYTVINRALLHLVPMLLFYVMVLFWENKPLPGMAHRL
ncbi:MAG: hypothetical protein Q8P42_15420 [Gallionella sp.]|nr:hypothetical protein [Gallionella sp.]